jgi:hypothetical protein
MNILEFKIKSPIADQYEILTSKKTMDFALLMAIVKYQL